MLYDTINQPLLFVAMMISGIVGGALFLGIKNIEKIFKKRFFSHIFDFFAIFLSFFLLFLTNLIFHYGIFRIFPIAVYFLFFFLTIFLSKKYFAKWVAKCYTLIKGKKNGKNQS